MFAVILILTFYIEIILRLNRSFGLKQHITLPTRITAFTKSCIDLLITNIPISKVVGVLCDVVSDHHPVFICIKKKRLKPVYVKIKGRTYRK